jgi:Zn-dependent protease with chaperone function
MILLARFLVYNLLLSLAGGVVVWLIVLGAVRLLDIRSSAFRICFLSLPIIKSTLILLGVGLILPWPRGMFANWHALALPFWQVLPFFFLWLIGINLVYFLLLRRTRRAVMHEALPAAEVSPRLAAAYAGLLESYRRMPCPACDDDWCCIELRREEPRLLVSERLHSPLAVTDGGEAAILFPTGLVSRLNEAELAGALAHELAHFVMRRPGWCSAGTLQKLTLINPVTSLMAESLHRQEEKACDELAVSLVGQPEVYAGMLTKSYRFAKEHSAHVSGGKLDLLPRLVGFRPLLTERVEHLLSMETKETWQAQLPLMLWLVWGTLFSALFLV